MLVAIFEFACICCFCFVFYSSLVLILFFKNNIFIMRPKGETEGQLYIIIFNLIYETFETKQPIQLTKPLNIK